MLLKAYVKDPPIIANILMTSKQIFERDYDKYIHRIIKAKHDSGRKY